MLNNDSLPSSKYVTSAIVNVCRSTGMDLTAIARDHRIPRRILDLGICNYSEELQLEQQHHEAQESLRRRRMCQRQLSDEGAEWVQLKGDCAAILAGSAIRASNDLDALGPFGETPRLAVIKNVGDQICHEAGHLYDEENEVKIDLHYYMPTFTPSTAGLTFGEISSDLIRRTMIPHPDVDGWYVPSMEVAAAVLVAHYHRSFYEYPLTKLGKLCEVLEFIDIAEHHSFQWNVFYDILRETQAQSAFDFVMQVIDTICNDGVLKSAIEIARGIEANAILGCREFISPAHLLRSIFDLSPKSSKYGRGRGSIELISNINNGRIIVSATLPGTHYKNDVRLILEDGSWLRVINRLGSGDTSMNISTVGTGDLLKTFNASLDGNTIRIEVPVIAATSALITACTFFEPVTTSWKDFYERSLFSAVRTMSIP